MDCDASLDPAELPTVTAPLLDGSAQLVLGARVAERGAMALHARIANRYLARAVRHRYGFDLRDLGPMRATHRDALLGLGMQDRRSGWPLEMVLRAGAAGWQVIEVPVSYRARAGKSKVTGTVVGHGACGAGHAPPAARSAERPPRRGVVDGVDRLAEVGSQR